MAGGMSARVWNAAWSGSLAALLVLGGCGGSSTLTLPNGGKSMVMLPGQMSFEFEGVPHIGSGGPLLDLFWAIPPSSLTFVKGDSGFLALVDATVRLRRPDGKGATRDILWSDTVTAQTYEHTRGLTPFEGYRRIGVPPGPWVVEMIIEDGQTHSRAGRLQTVVIPDTASSVPQEGRIRLEWRHADGHFAAFVMFHVPSGLDSLRAVVQLFHLDPLRPARARVLFERFAGDTSVPAPPYGFSVSTRQFEPTTVLDFEMTDTVTMGETVLHPTDPETDYTFVIPRVGPGMYRITSTVEVPRASGDTLLTLRRTVSIKGETFPRPGTLSELVDALQYIAKPGEMERIRGTRTPAEERDEFDLFWIARTGNRESAAGLLRAYYTRVEEANRFFSTVKEGWRTDRGMIYIIFGPPAQISPSPEAQSWTYNFPGSYGANPFVFRRIPIEGEGIAFDEYVLVRQPEYATVWEELVSRWRRGAYLW